MKRKIVIAVSGLLVLIVVLAGAKGMQFKALGDAAKVATVPPETISATEVRQETWESLVPVVGTISPVQGVDIRAELAGTVRKLDFQSGGIATRGQLLVQLDTSLEEGQLRAMKAQWELADANPRACPRPRRLKA